VSDRRAAAIGLVALVATGCAVALVALSDHDTSKVATIALAVPVGLAFIAIGIVAARRRPENRTGLLMIATGFAWFAGALPESNNALLFSIGNLLGAASFGFLIHLVLAFPSGRLVGRGVRALAIGGYLLVGLANLGFMLVDDLKDDCVDCPRNVLLVSDVSAIADTIRALTALGAAILAGGVVTVLVRRWRAATPAMRRALTPVFTAGGITLLLAALLVVAQAAADALAPTFYWLLLVSLITVPLAFLAGLLRARLATAAVGRLLAETPETPTRAEAQESLRRALRDPTLDVAYWLADGERFVDADGRPVSLPDGRDRAVTEVQREGRRIAALVHDPALADEPELVASAGAAAALALENERLQAKLRARLEELRASRARIVEAAQQERRRIERDLHDGTQQRLVSIAMTLGLADSRLDRDPPAARSLLDEARASLTDALRELRELSQGIHPGILNERGLRAALEELAYSARLPLELEVALSQRLPDRVEAAAYYVVSEALTNIAKYAGASAVRIRVQRTDGRAVVEVADDGVGGADNARGTGLRGLADRVDALGGRLHVESPPGRGTVVHAEIPCA